MQRKNGFFANTLDNAEKKRYNYCAILDITVPETVMIVIDYASPTPIYEQVKTQILSLITCGVWKPGDQLPSLRVMAGELSLNFNTIKKVFAQLEADGVIVSRPGKGFFVAEGARENEAVLARAEAELTRALERARAAGLSGERAAALVNTIFGKENPNDSDP